MLPCSQDPEEAPVDCQSLLAPPRLGPEMAELDCGCLVPRHLGRWVTFLAIPCRWLHESSSTAERTLPERLPGCPGPSQKGFCPCLGAFHGGAKSPPVLLDRNINGLVYRDILWDTLVPFARQHFGYNFIYQGHPHITSMNSARLFWSSGPISLWYACSFWWLACPGN